MADLILDPIKVDTALAEEYLKKYNFDKWPQCGTFWHVKNYPTIDKYDLKSELPILDVKTDKNSIERGKQLSNKIRENESLFSQLEYLIRRTDVDDVKNNIKLLSQHLQCYDEFSPWTPDVYILMDEKTPLCTLGCVAHMLNGPDTAKIRVSASYIVTTQKMAPLCQLFIELCDQVGWTIPLFFVNNLEEYKESKCCNNNLFIKGANEDIGCIAVVTESADIESALDVFINSSVSALWKLTHIYVQESVYEEVKRVFAWKCSRVMVQSSTDAFAAKGKVFVCDLMSEDAATDHTIYVDAYRTAKEVRTLVAQHSKPFLSVWAANTASSHELALSSPATRVWINEYSVFDDPPRASLPVYDNIYPLFQPYIACDKRFNVSSPWTKLTANERVDLMLNALQDHLASVPADLPRVEIFKHAILNRRDDGFVSVNGDRICFGVEQPREIAMIEVSSYDRMSDVVNAIIMNNIIIYALYDIYVEFKGLFQTLERAGVQVIDYESVGRHDFRIPVINKKNKVISTNFGTVFAN